MAVLYEVIDGNVEAVHLEDGIVYLSITHLHATPEAAIDAYISLLDQRLAAIDAERRKIQEKRAKFRPLGPSGIPHGQPGKLVKSI